MVFTKAVNRSRIYLMFAAYRECGLTDKAAAKALKSACSDIKASYKSKDILPVATMLWEHLEADGSLGDALLAGFMSIPAEESALLAGLDAATKRSHIVNQDGTGGGPILQAASRLAMMDVTV